MFDVGFAELFLLALIGLLVLGPERLPSVARTIGGFVRKARTSWNSLRRTIESELENADISAPIKQAKEEFTKIGKDLADMPGLNPESPTSTSQEKAQPQVSKNQEPDGVKDTDSAKGENV